MNKVGKDKMVRGTDLKDKALKAAPAAAAHAQPEALICVSACNIPEVGTWRLGETVTDPAVIAKICGSPNFKKIEEEK
jgi:hypothetical protein